MGNRKPFERFSEKLSMGFPYNLGMPLPSIYPREMKIYVCTKTSAKMLIATLFIIGETWKQPKCPSTNEWIIKMGYIHTMEYYSAIKRSEVLINAKTWIKLKNNMLCERSQTQKAIDIWFYLYEMARKGKSFAMEGRLVVAWGAGKGVCGE